MRQVEKVYGFSVIRIFLACDRRFWAAENGLREIVSAPVKRPIDTVGGIGKK